MPASKMSLTARLMMRISVLVSELRPVNFLLSCDVFQMHAITDALPTTEIQTQNDNRATNILSTVDMLDDGCPILQINQQHYPAEVIRFDSIRFHYVLFCSLPF